MQLPFVSVLVISYNQENLIQETIESCLKQSYDNYEIVVSDDGSMDDTVQIIQGMQDKFPEKIKLIANEKNAGITKNCNLGLRHCRGELIAFMGGDDLLTPKKLEEQVAAFLGNHNLALCYHPCFVMHNGEINKIIGNRTKDLVRNFVEMVEKFGAAIPGPAVMVRTSAIPDYGFDETIKTASDWLFYIDVSSKGDVVRLDKPLSIYRLHQNNIGHQYFSYSQDFIKTIEIVKIRYGKRPGVKTAADKGARRFLLGVIYRALEQDRPDIARKYTEQIRDYTKGGLSALLFALTFVPGIGIILRGVKDLLKKYV